MRCGKLPPRLTAVPRVTPVRILRGYMTDAPTAPLARPLDEFPPVVQIFKKSPEIARALGYPGQADQKVSLVQSKYIIVDMFAKAVQGESPEAAVAWAETEMKQAYGQT